MTCHLLALSGCVVVVMVVTNSNTRIVVFVGGWLIEPSLIVRSWQLALGTTTIGTPTQAS